jgi:hypothetical protein
MCEVASASCSSRALADASALPPRLTVTTPDREGGFLDRDLYPYCFNANDGTIVASASPAARVNIGKDERTIRRLPKRLVLNSTTQHRSQRVK